VEELTKAALGPDPSSNAVEDHQEADEDDDDGQSSWFIVVPSRNAPAFSHFEMSRRMIGSAIRWATMRRSH
jgi:hypothetical protein